MMNGFLWSIDGETLCAALPAPCQVHARIKEIGKEKNWQDLNRERAAGARGAGGLQLFDGMAE